MLTIYFLWNKYFEKNFAKIFQENIFKINLELYFCENIPEIVTIGNIY